MLVTSWSEPGIGGSQPLAFTVLMLGLYASIVLIFIAADAVLFLLAWEVMSVLSYLLIVHERGKENDHVGAGYLLLAMGEPGHSRQRWVFWCWRSMPVHWICRNQIQHGRIGRGCALDGFSAFVFRFWREGRTGAGEILAARAYRVAPRAFVPVLAGATLNLGLYGILRVNADLCRPRKRDGLVGTRRWNDFRVIGNSLRNDRQ